MAVLVWRRHLRSKLVGIGPADHVSKGACAKETYRNDLAVARYVSHSIRRIHTHADDAIPVCMNHIITFFNCFTQSAAVACLYDKVPHQDHDALGAFLLFLGKHKPTSYDGVLLQSLMARYPLNNTNRGN